MRTGHYISCLALSFCMGNLSAQERDYSEADQFAMDPVFAINNKKDLDRFIRVADLHFPDTTDKVRAVFYWIAKNLEYDCGREKQGGRSAYSIDNVLASHRSNCSGYSDILQYCLSQMGIESARVHGLARTSRKDLAEGQVVPATIRSNHDWNAVRINGKWRLLDPTWASGAADDDCNTVVREFEEFYFFPDPAQLALTHYPSDQRWQLTDTLMSREAFLELPLFRDPFHHLQVREFSPAKGILHLKKNEPVQFRFQTGKKLEKIILWRDDLPGSPPESGSFLRQGNEYLYTYRPSLSGDYFLNLSLDGRQCAMIYRLVVE